MQDWYLFRDFGPTIRWADLVDIVLVTFLIYRLLLFIKGTRAVQILSGLSLLFVIFWIADRFEIRALRTILSNVFDNLFIIFIVIFQNDIRRVFSQVGKRSLIGVKDQVKEGQFIEELVKSCVSLANKKIGALIVLEREADVLDFIESGIIVDATLSKETLTSVFLPVSPMHDGAVLIRKGRIHMAGCFLPLTLNPLISKSMGTRHRAALGITEETDAICIVISEENGSLSFASHGKIVHDIDGAALRKKILEE